ncbi:hypothetical protein [Sulfurimonas marina]|uniref:Cytochrome c n=1 Tax=Sulfurimonas marina TaxID=2590551 RepID=A0A7M1AUL2_9BACT|nr:hypothetical protein [Sulfurimonas marina]QOP41109.1 hypothetical protein FJR03_04870 [Sulfurimonas marina]
MRKCEQMYKKVLFVSAVLLGWSGCSMTETQTHKEQGPQLQFIMRDLNTIVGNNQKSELEREDERRRYALSLVDAINKFSAKAHDKTAKLQTKYINENNIVAFNKHLDALEKKSQEIEKIAKNYELEQLDQEIVELETICTSCHKDLGVTHVQKLF